MAKSVKTSKKQSKTKRKNRSIGFGYWSRLHPVAAKLLVIALIAVPGYFVSAWYFARAATTIPALSIQALAGEGSGMVASRQYPGVNYWLRDGGTATADKPRDAIFAVKFDANGNPVPVRGTDKFPFYNVTGSPNNNWEDIAMDDTNNIWIGDIGANNCDRNNQKLIKIKEPNPSANETLTILASYTFKFPDPVTGCNTWNSEAMFWLDGKMYIFAKNSGSSVYRVDLPSGTSGTATLTKLGSLTGGVSNISVSSISDDRTRLVVAGHAKMNMYKTTNPSLRGDALIKDLISRAPAYVSTFSTGTADKPTVEGGSFKRGSYDVAFVSENKYIYYATPRTYGDTGTTNPNPNPDPDPTDTTAPSVSVGSPTSGATVSGKVVIGVVASDNVGVTRVNIFYDGTGVIREGTAQGTYGWGTIFDTTRLSNGPHTLSAVAYDAAGNTKTVQVPVVVSNGGDTTAPAISITDPVYGATLGGTIIVNVTATDDVAVKSVYIYYDDVGIIREGIAQGVYGWGSAFNTTKVPNGLRTIKAVATDTSGNTRTVQVQINVQN